MAEIEPRWPCPVCLGINLDKAVVGKRGKVRLDHCMRCGGVWFQLGEIQQLRRKQPQLLWARIPDRKEAVRTSCHACHAIVERSVDRCPACGHKTKFKCPECDRTMQQTGFDGLTLDVCRKCKGVWFDHHELAAIWKLELQTSLKRNAATAVARPDDGTGTALLLDAMIFAPDAMFYTANAAGAVISASVEAVGHAPATLGGAIEVVGDAAGSVFEAIVEIVGAIFSSFG